MGTPEAESEVASPHITVNGVTFQGCTGRIWKLPGPGGETPIDLKLQITNQRDAGVRFNWFDTVHVVLIDPNGRPLPLDGGRNATRPGEAASRLVMPGEKLVFLWPAKLVWANDKTILRLLGSDGFGGIWYFDALAPGKYKVRFNYANDRARIGDMGPLWTGQAVTPVVEVVLQ